MTPRGAGIFLPVYLVVVLLALHTNRWAKNPQLNALCGASPQPRQEPLRGL